MRRVTSEKTCYCHTCDLWIHWLGITNHRKAHRLRKQDCKITFTYGDTHTYNFNTPSA